MTSIYTEFTKQAQIHNNKPAVYFFTENAWHSYSYRALSLLVDQFAAGLQSINLGCEDRVAILLDNSPAWLISDLSINKIGAISVPIHTTSTNDGVKHVLEDAQVKCIIIKDDYYNRYSSTLHHFRNLFVVIKSNIESNLKYHNHYSFASLVNTNNDPIKPRVKESIIASIIYTSGTTGPPKGVMLSNENFISNATAASKEYEVTASDKFLSFLPLSHVLERTLGSYIPILNGAAIYYSRGVKMLKQDLVFAKPSVLVAVPVIFERFFDRIHDRVKSKGRFKEKLFYWALNKKNCFVAQKLILSKIRKIFGGNIRFCVSGGASLSPHILKFFQIIKIDISEGYGLTETSPIVCANRLNNLNPGKVGPPLPGVEVKISSTKEVLVRGRNVMQGYWNNAEKTKQAIDNEGWFRTGDLGHINQDRILTLIGRSKDMIVTSNGKKTSPDKLENLLNLSSSILQSIVVGHNRSMVVALVYPNHERLLNIPEKQITTTIQDEINIINNKLESHERIRKFSLLQKPLSEEDGDLTPTKKLKRFKVENKYQKEISKLFDK